MNTAQDAMSPKPVARQNLSARNSLELLDYAKYLWAGRVWIAASTALFILIGAYYAFVAATPMYTAKATLALESRQEQVVDLESVVSGLSGDQATINTEVEVLKSRELMGKLVAKFSLLEDPEFNSRLREGDVSIIKSGRTEQDMVIDALLKRFRITNLRQSYVFDVRATTANPAKSARLANGLAQLYIQDQLEVKFLATEQATAWLSDRVGQLQQELEAAEAEVKAFNSSTSLISLDALTLLNTQVKDLRERLLQTPDPETMPEGAARDRMVAQRASLEVGIEARQQKINQQSGDLVRLRQLQRESEASRLIYEHFLARLKETSIQQGIQQADSRILSLAAVPSGTSSPRKMLILISCIIFGALTGVAAVFLRELSNRTIRSVRELEELTDTVVMGQIPVIANKETGDVLRHFADNPSAPEAEAIRDIRTSVLLSNLDNPPKVIILTSSVPNEGKTTNSLALAQNLAGMGKQVLIIEGDIRKRSFSTYFETKGQLGLLSVLSGRCDLKDAIFRADSLNIDVLVGEKASTNAADLFSSETFKKFIVEVRRSYDYIVIDTPPVLSVPDARVIAQNADAVLFVVHWGKTLRHQVLRSMQLLQNVGIEVTGFLLGNVKVNAAEKYGYAAVDDEVPNFDD